MTLRNVLKGHKTDRNVLVTIGYKSCEWSGDGIEHIVNRYCPELLDRKVKNTTKTWNGKTVIEVA